MAPLLFTSYSHQATISNHTSTLYQYYISTMQTFALIGLVCLWATQVSAAAQPAITARAALPSDFIGMGTFDSTSANAC